MKTPLLLLREFLFWMGLFVLLRLLFIIYNSAEVGDSGFLETLMAFWHGAVLDVSFTCYIVSVSFLLLLIEPFLKKNFLKMIRMIWGAIWIVVILFICFADLEIYREWGVKINSKAVGFLSDPMEVIQTSRPTFLVVSLIVIAILTVILFKLYQRLLKLPAQAPALVLNLLFILISPVLLAYGIRGGFSPIPLQVSDAYYSKNNFLNLAASNTLWQLSSSLIENQQLSKKNPFVFYSDAEAQKTTQKLHTLATDSQQLVLNNRPNIMLVIMEGVSSDMIAGLGGYEKVAPALSQLCTEGISFDSLFSSGNLSDQGMSAIFSGFPAQPYVSITMQPDKFVKLPTLTSKLKNAGYSTSFLFGGQLSYGNIKAYMMHNGFDQLREGSDLEGYPEGRLGIHDEFILEELLQRTGKMKQPFFSSVFTSSTHSPYDYPDKKEVFHSEHEENEYVNSVNYFDRKLQLFLENVKKESWYPNTLFVFMSDHSHRTPMGYERTHPLYRRIPLIFWGELIPAEWKGKKLTRISSQVDLAATLLGMVRLDASDFHWSKDLFNSGTPEFAYFENTDGFGWIRPGNTVTWSSVEQKIILNRTRNKAISDSLEKEGKSYLQVMFKEYLGD